MGANWAVLAAWIAAVVSLASAVYTWGSRWWNRPAVHWLCDGYARRRPEGLEVNLHLVNCGDAAAYGVETIRCNGGDFHPFTVFEAGVVPAGGSVSVLLTPTTETWESCWVELRYRQSPTKRSPEPQTTGRLKPSQELADPHRLAPGFDPRRRESGQRAPDLDQETDPS